LSKTKQVSVEVDDNVRADHVALAESWPGDLAGPFRV